jgi:hypothetical protein
MRSSSQWLWFALAMTALGCGDNHESSLVDAAAIDAAPPRGPCWPIDTATPKGSIQLGKGIDAFEPMPEELPLVYGVQGGFHIEARSKIWGLAPGDPSDVLGSVNPYTYFRAYSVDGQRTNDVPCPGRAPYVPDPSGDGDVLVSYTEIRFPETLGPSDLFDRQYHVVVEVIDATGGYAWDEKIITARAPPEWSLGLGAHSFTTSEAMREPTRAEP